MFEWSQVGYQLTGTITLWSNSQWVEGELYRVVWAREEDLCSVGHASVTTVTCNTIACEPSQLHISSAPGARSSSCKFDLRGKHCQRHNGPRRCPKPTLRYFWVLWGTSKYFEVLLGILRYFFEVQILPILAILADLVVLAFLSVQQYYYLAILLCKYRIYRALWACSPTSSLFSHPSSAFSAPPPFF